MYYVLINAHYLTQKYKYNAALIRAAALNRIAAIIRSFDNWSYFEIGGSISDSILGGGGGSRHLFFLITLYNFQNIAWLYPPPPSSAVPGHLVFYQSLFITNNSSIRHSLTLYTDTGKLFELWLKRGKLFMFQCLFDLVVTYILISPGLLFG